MKTIKYDHKWFIAQFGERPKRSLWDINEDLDNTRCKLSYLEKELFAWEIYHAKEDAALKTFVNTMYQIKCEED